MDEAAAAVGDFVVAVRCGTRCCDVRVKKVCGKRTLARARSRTEYRARIGRHRHPPPGPSAAEKTARRVGSARDTHKHTTRVRTESFSSNVDSGAQSGRSRDYGIFLHISPRALVVSLCYHLLLKYCYLLITHYLTVILFSKPIEV